MAAPRGGFGDSTESPKPLGKQGARASGGFEEIVRRALLA
jgi:hypothetical protein